MCQALMEIMESQLLFRVKEGRIEGTVDTMRDFGYGDAEIKKLVNYAKVFPSRKGGGDVFISVA